MADIGRLFIENNKVRLPEYPPVPVAESGYKQDSAPGEIDLHGLYVKEAIARADEAIIQAKGQDRSELRLIVGWWNIPYLSQVDSLPVCSSDIGKGLHSQGGVAKIKPAIEELMEKLSTFPYCGRRTDDRLSLDITSKPNLILIIRGYWLWR